MHFPYRCRKGRMGGWGEQVALLWNILFQKYYLKIHFAHRTFKWSNEAKGNAAVQ